MDNNLQDEMQQSGAGADGSIFRKILNKIINFFLVIWQKIRQFKLSYVKNFFIAIGRFYGHKPKNSKEFGQAALKYLLTLYLIGLIFFAVVLYKYEWENRYTKIAVRVFPLPAAFIGNHVIWESNFQKQIGYLRNYSEKTSQPLDDKKTLYRRVLDQMIDSEIIQMQASRMNVKVTDKEIADNWQKIIDESGGKDQVDKVLSELYGISEPEFKQLILSQLLTSKIQSDKIMQVNAAHILIKDENRAKEILDRTKKGEDFGALAKEFSEDAGSRDKGGSLGWFSTGTMVPEFEKAAFALEKSQISDLVKTEFGFHIIKLEDKKGDIPKGFNDWLSEVRKKTFVWRLAR